MGGWTAALTLLLLWQLAVPAAAAPRAPALEGETVNMLDASVQLMQVRVWPTEPLQGSPGAFDRDYLGLLSTCMASLSPDLWAVSDGAWAGMVAYHDSNGTGWHSSLTQVTRQRHLGQLPWQRPLPRVP